MTPRSVFVALLVLVAPAALAGHAPEGPCMPEDWYAQGVVEITDGTRWNTFYIDDRGYATGNGLWVYMESNLVWWPRAAGVYRDDVTLHNLQRGGASPFVPGDDDACVDEPRMLPDTLVL